MRQQSPIVILLLFTVLERREPILAVDVAKRLGNFQLRAQFVADVPLTAIFGPSGSGKSLTLRALAGLLRPDAGRIEHDGVILFDAAQGIDLPPQRRQVGLVVQNYALFPHMTVHENIAFGLRGLSQKERRARVEELLLMLNLTDLADRRPNAISGGQAQRVALARALAPRPRLLLLDEPFAALDEPLRRSLRAKLLEIQARWGITMLTITHDLAEAFALGERVIVYDNGHVIQQGTREEVFFHPADRRVAELVGTGNILPAVVERGDDRTLWLRWHDWQIAAAPAPFAPGTPVYLCIRPTQVLIVRPDRIALRERENVFCGEIVREMMQAETYTLYIRLDDSRALSDLELALPAYVYHRLSLDTEKRIMVELRRQALHIIPREPEV